VGDMERSMKRITLRLVATLFGISILFAPMSAAAWNPFSDVDCGSASTSAVCTTKPQGNPIAGPDGILIKITNIIAFIAGIAVVIMLIIGGLRYVLADGESNDVASAKNTIIYALVGIFVIAVARTLIVFVVSRL